MTYEDPPPVRALRVGTESPLARLVKARAVGDPRMMELTRRSFKAGIIIHTFEIKANLILISNPIMAYAYQKHRKTAEKQ